MKSSFYFRYICFDFVVREKTLAWSFDGNFQISEDLTVLTNKHCIEAQVEAKDNQLGALWRRKKRAKKAKLNSQFVSFVKSQR